MLSYSLLTLTFVLVALFATQQVSAVPAQDRQACIENAYTVFDERTRGGCKGYGDSYCKKVIVEYSINVLNSQLNNCERSDYATLCRITPGGFFSGGRCHSFLTEGGEFTRAECKARASKDYRFHTQDGTEIVHKAKDSRCIYTKDYDCSKLC